MLGPTVEAGFFRALVKAHSVCRRRAFGDRQQPVRAFAEAVCDRAKELALCQYAAWCAGKRSDLQHRGDGEGKRTESDRVSHVSLRADAEHGSDG